MNNIQLYANQISKDVGLLKLDEMAPMLRTKESGLSFVIYVSDKTGVQHGPRVKISPHSSNGSFKSKEEGVPVTIHPSSPEFPDGVDYSKVPKSRIADIKKWILINHEPLLELWHNKITYKQFLAKLKNLNGHHIVPPHSLENDQLIIKV